MKQTSLTGLVLTLLMLLLVLIAAFVFLFQGRQTVIDQRDNLESETADLQQDLAQTELDLAAVEATRAITADALATAESNALLLDGELVHSQQEVDALTAQLDAASQTITTLQDEQEAVLAQPPDVAILSPANGRLLSQGALVNIVLVATDPKGISSVNLAINEEPFETYLPNNETLFTAVAPWEPAVPNEYVIQLTAVNSEGITSRSATVTVTVALADTVSRPANDSNAGLRQDIAELVSGLRQLPIPDDLNELLVSGVQLRQAQTDVARTLVNGPMWLDAGLIGQAFDFAPAEFDYEDMLALAGGDSTPAFYQPLSGEMLLIEQADTLTAVAQLGYVRQLLYLLQDQNFSLDALYTGELTLDGALALAALSEGEATVLQENFLTARYLPLEPAVIPETFVLDTAAFADTPTPIANWVRFPYEFGDDFARTLFESGSYPALDEAWANPPQSTEQILHPELYQEQAGPLLVTIPDLVPVLGDAWTLATENVLGEFLLGQYLLQQLNETQVETAVTGWGGDRFVIYTNEADDSFAMALHTVWDSTEDSTEFAALYPNYPTRLFITGGELQENGGECWPGEDEFICLYQSEQETLIVRGPELELVLDVVAAIFPAE
ncbi:Ig-like domain-containing protein [Candidatus Leptofilum sp.]|uniref:Ig-like domain-containing protein n=1 Tax=Candidatus Leptofilum sp. TaxID=3241576 RepID=UPI003B5B90F8